MLLKPPEFTEEDQVQLGRAFGSQALYGKFVQAVAVRVLGIIAKLFDVENISEVATRLQRFDEMLEKLNKDWLIGVVCQAIFGVEKPEEIPGALLAMVDEAVRRRRETDDEFAKRLCAALNRPEVQEAMGTVVLELRQTEVRGAREARASAIREQIGVRYGAENVSDDLVRLVADKLVLAGHSDRWPRRIADFLAKLEERAVTTIRELLLKKHEGDDVSAYAKFVVLSGVDPEDPRAVHALLAKREDIAKMLKRRV